MIPGSAVAALFDLMTREGYDVGDAHIKAETSGAIRWERQGETLVFLFDPPLQAKTDGFRGIVERGAIRRVTLTRDQAVAYVETSIFGTHPKTIEVSR